MANDEGASGQAGRGDEPGYWKPIDKRLPWWRRPASDWPLPSLQAVSAFVVFASLLTGLAFNAGFIAAISWDFMGILETGDFISAAITSSHLVAGAFLGVVMLLIIALVASIGLTGTVRHSLDQSEAQGAKGWAPRWLILTVDAMDRKAAKPEQAISSLSTRAAIGMLGFLFFVLLILIAWATGKTSRVGAYLAFAWLLWGALTVCVAVPIIERDELPSWPVVLTGAIPLAVLLAANKGAEKADEAWDRGKNLVELRTRGSEPPYRLLESFGKGVLMRDGAGNVYFAPWSNVDKITVPNDAAR